LKSKTASLFLRGRVSGTELARVDAYVKVRLYCLELIWQEAHECLALAMSIEVSMMESISSGPRPIPRFFFNSYRQSSI
jgi:hypothetical protein